ncbi:VENN motif pre-toxin domain-containing protein, partial [Paralysiella testudinis]
VGAVGGSNTADVVSGSQVAQNAVENNWLSAKEVNRLVELDRACSKGAGKACKGYLDLRKLDQERDLRLLAACQQPSSAACRNLKAQANIANASLASGYFDPVLHPELWSDKEKASAHKKEYSDTDAVLRLSEGWTPEQIMREAALLNATRTVLADLTIVGTIKDFKEADTLADYATAIILAAPGLKQADTLKHAGDFTRAYKAAKEAGDLKAAKEIIELARTAEKSPNNLAKLAQKEQAIVSGRAISAEGQSLLQSAEAPFKGQPLTNAGRATTKHPEYFGFNSTDELRAVYRTDAQLNDTNSTKYNTIEPKPKLPQTPPCPN